ncbi:MAG: DUF4293 domain-containing protein [Bernardetiaceae bacterium]|nr:DUF4293 domain-containing protein [Bernardetiaceae bacterium]
MIQRLQSITLLLVTILMATVIFMPLWTKSGGGQHLVLTSFNLTMLKGSETVEQSTTVYLAIIAGISAIVAFAAIFLYTNRMLQMRLAMLNSFFIAIFLAICIYIEEFVMPDMLAASGSGVPAIGFWLPVVAIVLSQISAHLIRKDENMVRSADRLR